MQRLAQVVAGGGQKVRLVLVGDFELLARALDLAARPLGSVACGLGRPLGRGKRLFPLLQLGDVAADNEQAAAVQWFDIELDVSAARRPPFVPRYPRNRRKSLLDEPLGFIRGTEIAALGQEANEVMQGGALASYVGRIRWNSIA